MLDGLRKLFANQTPASPVPTVAEAAGIPAVAVPDLCGLNKPEAAFQKAAVPLSDVPVTPQPAPVVEVDDDHQLPRTPAQIRELLKTETPEATTLRIASDKRRYQNLCNGDVVPRQVEHVPQEIEPPKVEVQQLRPTATAEQRGITMPEQEQVLKFIQSGPADGTTALEIGGGTGLPRETVSEILAGVVASGEVIKIGDLNTAVYRAVQPSFVPVEPTVPFVSAEAKWNAEAQARERAKMEAQRPKPEPNRIPKLDEIILPEPVKPLTEAERKDYEISHRNRRPIINPNAYLVR